MADDGRVSDGSDIDVDDGEIGSDFGDSEPGEQQQRRATIHPRRPSSDDDSDSSEFGGFQLSWQEGGFTRRTPLNFRGVGGAAVQHPPEASPGMYFKMFWTVAMWLHLVTETNRYADQERQRKPPPPSAPIWMPVTVHEMKAFVGLCFAMGVLRLPSRNDYWRQTKWLLKTEFG